MHSSEADEIEARLERVRKREEDLDGRLALLVAKEQYASILSVPTFVPVHQGSKLTGMEIVAM